MTCTESIVCLGDYCSCGDTIALTLQAAESATYEMRAKFNGVLLTRNVQVVSGQPVAVPNIFNENYKFILAFYRQNGEPAFQTSFSINIIPCVNTE